jgi:PAS domain S-box-containing protein
MNLEDLYRLLRSSHVQAQGIIDTLEEPLLVLDQTGCVINGNRAFFEKFILDRDDTIGRSLFALGTHQWDIPELRSLLHDVIPKSVAIIGFELTADFPPIGRRIMLMSARRLAHPDNNSTSILMVFEDVTEKRRGDAEKDILLGETRHRMKNLLAIVQALATQTEVEGRSGQQYLWGVSRRWSGRRTYRSPAMLSPSLNTGLQRPEIELIRNGRRTKRRVWRNSSPLTVSFHSAFIVP